MIISTTQHLIITNALSDLNLLNDFERKFMNSLSSDKNIHKNYIRYGCYNVSEYTKEFGISNKQYVIYERISKKFDKLSIYDKYFFYFKFHKIKLDDYDNGYFETFKDEYVESSSFKIWLKDVKNRNKTL